MIHPDRLLQTPGSRVCFDTRSEPIEAVAVPGPAVMLVSTVTDALKTVSDGLVTGAVDRDQVARVVGFALDRGVLTSLGERPLRPEQLIEAVRARGLDWAVARQEDPLRPLRAQ